MEHPGHVDERSVPSMLPGLAVPLVALAQSVSSGRQSSRRHTVRQPFRTDRAGSRDLELFGERLVRIVPLTIRSPPGQAMPVLLRLRPPVQRTLPGGRDRRSNGNSRIHDSNHQRAAGYITKRRYHFSECFYLFCSVKTRMICVKVSDYHPNIQLQAGFSHSFVIRLMLRNF